MTPQEALNILYNATRKLNGTADDHQKLKECAETLQRFISEAKAPKKLDKPKE